MTQAWLVTLVLSAHLAHAGVDPCPDKGRQGAEAQNPAVGQMIDGAGETLGKFKEPSDPVLLNTPIAAPPPPKPSAPSPSQVCDAVNQPFPSPNPNDGLKEDPSPDPACPAGSVRVADFCMDRYMGSLEEVQDDGTVSAWSPFHNPVWPGNYLGQGKQQLTPAKFFRAISAKGAYPQGHISKKQAEQACANHSPTPKRLCTAKEWLRACQGPGPQLRMYPYGGTKVDDRIPGACNDSPKKPAPGETFRRSPMLDLYEDLKKNGKKVPDTAFGSFMDNACITQLPDSINRGGDKSDCKTPEGVYDMVGNLHEWTAEIQPNKLGVFRGGYFLDTWQNTPGCTYATVLHGVEHYEYSTGFRCCANPKED